MGLWDYAADIKILREAHLTFQFSVFTFQFISREAHLTFHFSPFTFHLTNTSPTAERPWDCVL